MSGTLPSSPDDSTDAEGAAGDDASDGDASDPRADGGAATGSDASTPVSLPEDATTDAADETERTETTASAGAASEAAADPEDGTPTGSDQQVRVCWLDDDGADDLIGALAPETARRILTAVHEEPRTASELADAADTSVQNVRHHVSKLVDAGLVETVDTRYSVKGREMTVYGPTDDRVVVAVGGESDRSSLTDSLGGFLGALAVLAGASLLVQALFGAGVTALSGPETAPRIGDAVGATGGAALGALPPGAAFFAGGLLVLATVVAVGRLRER